MIAVKERKNERRGKYFNLTRYCIFCTEEIKEENR